MIKDWSLPASLTKETNTSWNVAYCSIKNKSILQDWLPLPRKQRVVMRNSECISTLWFLLCLDRIWPWQPQRLQWLCSKSRRGKYCKRREKVIHIVYCYMNNFSKLVISISRNHPKKAINFATSLTSIDFSVPDPKKVSHTFGHSNNSQMKYVCFGNSSENKK